MVEAYRLEALYSLSDENAKHEKTAGVISGKDREPHEGEVLSQAAALPILCRPMTTLRQICGGRMAIVALLSLLLSTLLIGRPPSTQKTQYQTPPFFFHPAAYSFHRGTPY